MRRHSSDLMSDRNWTKKRLVWYFTSAAENLKPSILVASVGQQALGSRRIHYGFVFFGRSPDSLAIGLILFGLTGSVSNLAFIMLPWRTKKAEESFCRQTRPQKWCLLPSGSSGPCVQVFVLCLFLFAQHTKCHKLILCGCPGCCLLFSALILFAKIVNIISFSDALKHKMN